MIRYRRAITGLLAVLPGLLFLLLLTLLRPSGFDYYHQIPTGDMAQALNGAAWYLKSPLTFPIFDFWVDGLNSYYNLVYSDSAPLYVLLLKLPYRFGLEMNSFLTWHILVFSLQSASFYWLLSCIGVRSKALRLIGACVAILMPTFLHRLYTDHLTLSGHFVVILMLALFFYSRKLSLFHTVCSWSAYIAGSLLIHPYFCAMSILIYLGHLCERISISKLTLRPTSLLCLTPFLVLALTVFLAGPFHRPGITPDTGGFGVFSMNLLSPVWPAHSALFGDLAKMNATRGQSEGYNYLGGGVIVGLFYATIFCVSSRRNLVFGLSNFFTRGTLFFLLTLSAYSLSSLVYAGHILIFDLNWLYAPFKFLTLPFRSSGRFFWPVVYFGLAVLFFILDRFRDLESNFLKHLGITSGLLVLVLQLVDVMPLVHMNVFKPVSGLNSKPWVELFQSHDALQLSPRSGCTKSPFSHYVNSALALAAVKYDLRINSFPSVRHASPCPVSNITETVEVAQNTLHIHHSPPNNEFNIGKQFNIELCRVYKSMYVCSQKISLVSDYPEFSPLASDWRLQRTVSYSIPDHDEFGRLLLSNWYAPEPWGVWTKTGEVRMLLPRFVDQQDTTLLSFDIAAFFSDPAGKIEVPVSVNGEHRTTWGFSAKNNRGYRLLLIKSSDYGNGLPIIHFSIPPTISLFETEISSDLRKLGLSLYGFGADFKN